MQHKILLMDELGKKYGETHVYYNLKTPAEAIKLLCINYPEFAKDVFKLQEQGIFYKVQQVDIDLELSDLFLPLGSHDLVITPVLTGSGNLVKAALGVVLVATTGGIGAALTGTSALFGSATLGSIGAKLGVALILDGVSDILSPQPQFSNLSAFDAPVSGFTGGAGGITRGSDGSQSYGYTGAANTVGLGKTIPVVYGQALIGGHILSTDIEIAPDSDPLLKFIRPPSLSSVRLNGEEVKGKYTSLGGINARILNGPAPNGTAKFGSSTAINLKKEGGQNIVDITGTLEGITNTKRFQMLFQVAGLVDFVGDKNTTRIDGFITYAVRVVEISDGTVVLNSQSTIQGLTTKTQKFNYICKLPFPFIDGKNDYRVKIEIVDTSVDFTQASFKVIRVGYNLRNK
jgi:predicted phage tail protein